MLESVAYIGLGLGRAAIGAIRTQIDLLLGFTYFYDHPYEWNSVKTTGKGFKLRSDIDKHHKDTRKKFASDIDKIEHSEGRSLLSLYRILSAHIHGQSRLTVPKAGRFVELISSDSFSDSLITLQMQVSISISNYLTAVFLSEGIDPPLVIGTRIKKQLNDKKKQKHLCTGQKFGNGRETRPFPKRADSPTARKSRVSFPKSFFCPVHSRNI